MVQISRIERARVRLCLSTEGRRMQETTGGGDDDATMIPRNSAHSSSDEDDVEKASKVVTEMVGRIGKLDAAAAAAAANPESDDHSGTNSGSWSYPGLHWCWSKTGLITAMVLVLGGLSSAVFVWIGVSGAFARQADHFERGATDLVTQIESQFAEYVNAASIIHNRCRSRNFTRQDFRDLYEYIIDSGLEFKAVQFDPNVTRDEREFYEAEAREYYAENYPHVNYRGFVGFETEIPAFLEPRSEQDYYFPIHYMEPIPGNEAAIDLDYYSHISRRRTLEYCMEHGLPALTDRLVLVKKEEAVSRCGAIDPAYGVVLMHPGVNLTSQPDVWPRDLSSVVICIPDLLGSAHEHEEGVSSSVYIYDSSDSSGNTTFLGAVQVDNTEEGVPANLTFLPGTDIESLRESKLYQEQDIAVANKVWTVVVVANDGTYDPHLTFVILGGVIIFIAGVCLALWVYSSAYRVKKFTEMKANSEAEKAALILENARQATRAERELNDFIAHEVRNPVSAAMAACSFVKTAVNKKNPLADEESRRTVIEDVNVIDNSLCFVGDLLRNMLDMHRAADKQLIVSMAPTDVLHDILEPIAGMLYRRGDKVEVIVECPQNLYVLTDRLRLKQVILNLGRNSTKFISKGFIRLRAEVRDEVVQLSVEDSGSGIPQEKRELLFAKFQESLDLLSQGTGIGLFLCKNLVELMNGEIYLDDDYLSGIPGCPGTRFVVNLKVPPCKPPNVYGGQRPSSNGLNSSGLSSTSGHSFSGISLNERSLSGRSMNDRTESSHGSSLNGESIHSSSSHEGMNGTKPATQQRRKMSRKSDDGKGSHQLPEQLSVLFVDDDAMLRKLFVRSIKKVAPGWKCREAGSGESALHLVETESFDLIFMDMYMASVEKQLLGTETVAELRARGITCKICGLSANDKKSEFLEAGADAFVIKPFPCKAELLAKELNRILNQT